MRDRLEERHTNTNSVPTNASTVTDGTSPVRFEMTTEYSAKDIVVVRQLMSYEEIKKHRASMSPKKQEILKNGWKEENREPFINRAIPRKWWSMFVKAPGLEVLSDEEALEKYPELSIGMAPYRFSARFYNEHRIVSDQSNPLEEFTLFLRDCFEERLKKEGVYEEKLIFFDVFAPGGMFLEYETSAIWL